MDVTPTHLRRDYVQPLAGGGVERWDPSVGRWREEAPAEGTAPPSRALASVTSHLTRESSVTDIEDLLVNPANPQRGTRLEFIGPNRAGVHVRHEDAFMTAAVWACMDVIASSLASSDWNLYAGVRGSDKGKKALPEDQTQFLLNTRANPEMTALSAKRAVCLAAVAGNGYAEIEWDGAGRFAALWPITPDRVQPLRNERQQFVYRVTQDYLGNTVDLDPVDIFHIRGSSLIGSRGDDGIGRAIRTIAMNIALDEFAASYYANGTNLGGIITTKGKLDDGPFERLKGQWNNRRADGNTGARNAFKTAILEGGATFTQLDSNAQKADLTNWHYSIIEEVARWFRVPPHKIGHLLRATNNNIEHQGLEFTRDTLRPWAKEIEQEADYKLISARGPRRFVELDLDWASQGDYDSRATAFQKLLNTGVFTVNDVLRKLGENTIGKEGDVRLVQGAMIPIQRAGESFRTTGTPTVPESPGDPGVEKPSGQPPATPRAPTNALLQAWLGSIYAKARRRVQNARNRNAANPQAPAIEYLDAELEQLVSFLEEAGADGVAVAREHGLRAIEGRQADDEARAAIETITKDPA